MRYDRIEEICQSVEWVEEKYLPMFQKHAEYHDHYYVRTCRSGTSKVPKAQRGLVSFPKR